MPQKKNPDTLELTRGVAGDAIGEATGTFSLLKGLPRAYNRDLQRAHAGVFEVAGDVREATAVAAGAVATADWAVETLAETAGDGFSTATGVADLLAAAGMPFRTAHEVVAAAAETIDDADAPAAAAATIEEAVRNVAGDSLSAYVSRADIEAALDPVNSVADRDSAGGPAPDAVVEAIATAEPALDDGAAALDARRDRLATAADRRETEVATYV